MADLRLSSNFTQKPSTACPIYDVAQSIPDIRQSLEAYRKNRAVLPSTQRSTLHGNIYKCTSITKYSRCFNNPKASYEEPIPIVSTNFQDQLKKPLNAKPGLAQSEFNSDTTPRCKTAYQSTKPREYERHVLKDNQHVFSLIKNNALSRCYIERDSDNRIYVVPLLNQREHFDLQIQRVKLQTCVKKRVKPKKILLQKRVRLDTAKESSPNKLCNMPLKVVECLDRSPKARDKSVSKYVRSSVNQPVPNKSFTTGTVFSKMFSTKQRLRKSQTITKADTKLLAAELKIANNQSSTEPIEEIKKHTLIKRHKVQSATHKSRPRHPKPPPKEEPIVPERLKQKSRPVFIANDFYGFSIVEGNNSQLVKKCLEHRSQYWKEVPSFSSVFHYKWQPVSRGIRFELLASSQQKQMVNHFEGHFEITTKDALFKNFLAYCELNKTNAFDYLPLTFALDLDSPTYGSDFEKFAYCYTTIDSVNSSLDPLLENRDEVCLKQINQKLHRISFSKDRRVVSHSRAKITKSYFMGKNLWILKPTGFNRGRGISVFDTLSKLKSLIKLYSNDPLAVTNPEFSAGLKKRASDVAEIDPSVKSTPIDVCKVRTFVIQKYIERPLLVCQRKFDIRVWVLVTHEMRVYFFKEGYLRTSSEFFTLEGDVVANKNIHLTNNAVQKYSEKYGQFEDGNQLSFDRFQEYLDKTYPEKKISVRKDLMGQMKTLTTMSMMAIRRKLNPENRAYCMEIFGYDFIIDEDFKVWLIEINTNPCLEESSKLLQMILPRMIGNNGCISVLYIDDALKLTLDIVFPRKRRSGGEYTEQIEQPFKVTGYSDTENLWEFLCQIGGVKKAGSSEWDQQAAFI